MSQKAESLTIKAPKNSNLFDGKTFFPKIKELKKTLLNIIKFNFMFWFSKNSFKDVYSEILSRLFE